MNGNEVFEYIGLGVLFIVVAIVAIVIQGFLVSYLWNLIMPYLLKLPTIDWRQGFILIFLTRNLIGWNVNYNKK